MLSRFSTPLQREDAPTVPELFQRLSNAYTPHPECRLMTSMWDYRNIIDKEIGAISGHSRPHHFTVKLLGGKVQLKAQLWPDPLNPKVEIPLDRFIPRFPKCTSVKEWTINVDDKKAAHASLRRPATDPLTWHQFMYGDLAIKNYQAVKRCERKARTAMLNYLPLEVPVYTFQGPCSKVERHLRRERGGTTSSAQYPTACLKQRVPALAPLYEHQADNKAADLRSSLCTVVHICYSLEKDQSARQILRLMNQMYVRSILHGYKSGASLLKAERPSSTSSRRPAEDVGIGVLRLQAGLQQINTQSKAV
ncbi:ATP binding [Branchiostoma belcheri]|nr:ATP binding [Branchiostoma belcheri]